MNTAVPPKSESMWNRIKKIVLPKDRFESDLRFEKKFQIPVHELPQLELRLARYGCSPIHEPRWINNLYCDTHDYQHLYENIEGLSDRKKLRFRWYGEKNGELKITAEYKIKIDDTNTKESQKIGVIPFKSRTTLQNLFETCIQSWESCAHPNSHIPQNYTPTLLNRYYRKYYLNADDNIRLTIDTPIYYENAATGINAIQEDWAIVELKCPKNHIIHSDLMPYQLNKSSKYVDGLQLTDPLFEKSSI